MKGCRQGRLMALTLLTVVCAVTAAASSSEFTEQTSTSTLTEAASSSDFTEQTSTSTSTEAVSPSEFTEEPSTSTVAGPVYSDCQSVGDIDECECNPNFNKTKIVVKPQFGAMVACMTKLLERGPFYLWQLYILSSPDLNLSENILMNNTFDDVHIYDSKVVDMHEDFLGLSAEVTHTIHFENSIFDSGIPKLSAPALRHWKLSQSNDGKAESQLTITRATFKNVPGLETVYLVTRPGSVLVHRHVFRPLHNLLEVHVLASKVTLRFGAMHFTSPRLTMVALAADEDAGDVEDVVLLDAATGSFGGLPPGASLRIGKNINGWQPTKFFNILSSGVRILTSNSTPHECGCDLAWIRNSAFLRQVDLFCGEDSVPLEEYSLDHCTRHGELW